jgi:hypothetical protein
MMHTSLSRSHYVTASLTLTPTIRRGEKGRTDSRDADFVPGGHVPMQKCERVVSTGKDQGSQEAFDRPPFGNNRWKSGTLRWGILCHVC